MVQNLSRFVVILFAVLTTSLPLFVSSAFAEERVFHLVYHVPRVSDDEVKKQPGMSRDSLIVTKSRAVSKELARNIEKRLKTASVKDFRVTPENFEVKVSIGGKDAEEPQIAALLTGPHYVEIRPVLDKSGRPWENYRNLLPDGVKVVGVPPKSYLWSPNKGALTEFLKTASMLSTETVAIDGKPAEKRFVAGQAPLTPESKVGQKDVNSGGWRSYFLGPLLLSNDGISKSSWVMDGTGGYSTLLSLKSSVTLPANVSNKIAILVDDKLIAILPVEKVGKQIRLTAPPSLTKLEQRVWARALAGTFAAFISMPYGISNLPSQDE